MSVSARPRWRQPSASAAPLLVAAVVAAGCGGDDEDAADAGTSTSPTPPTRTVTAPARTAAERDGVGTAPPKREGSEQPGSSEDQAGGAGSPEDQPGGAGDEEPVRSEVVLSGRGGRIGPLLVKVPPFVSIRVSLRSADGKPYLMRFGTRVVKAGLKGARSSATFDGLRPGRRLVGAAVSGKVVIEASAEPGP